MKLGASPETPPHPNPTLPIKGRGSSAGSMDILNFINLSGWTAGALRR
jgi:hypothetical protein